nr:hypothetical protein [Tanacetum cinerariifolium]
ELELELELIEVGCLRCLEAPYPWSPLLVLVLPHPVMGLVVLWCRPIGIEKCASWVKGKGTWVCWGEEIGTVSVDAGAQESSHDSLDHVVRHPTTVENNPNNKRKWGSGHGRNSGQQQNKRLEVVRAYAAGPGNKKAYAENLPL